MVRRDSCFPYFIISLYLYLPFASAAVLVVECAHRNARAQLIQCVVVGAEQAKESSIHACCVIELLFMALFYSLPTISSHWRSLLPCSGDQLLDANYPWTALPIGWWAGLLSLRFPSCGMCHCCTPLSLCVCFRQAPPSFSLVFLSSLPIRCGAASRTFPSSRLPFW